MNLEDMKSTWKDDVDEAPDVRLDQQKSLRQPVDIICKNMKKDLPIQIFGMIVTFCMILFSITNSKFLFYAIVIFSSAVLMSLYYSMRLKGVYSSIQESQYTSYQSLLELNYSLKYFKDLYISYNLSLMPFVLCGYILWVDYFQGSNLFVHGDVPIHIVLAFIIICIYAFFTVKFTFHISYGKYIFSIAQLLKTIEQPYEDFDKSIIHTSNGNYLYGKTEKFCIEKMGNFGEKVNFIIWQCLLLVILSIILKILIM